VKIFITGASGFVGGAIAKELVKNNEVFGMARSEKSATKIIDLGATPVLCSLNHVKNENLEGCDLIIHAAAYVEAWGTRKQYWDINVEGTKQLLATAKSTGVKKFIHISSEATLFYGQEMNNIDETYPYPKKTPYLYSETKAAAEKLVVLANQEGLFETVVIRPRMIWGPNDQTILPELIKLIDKGSFMWINNGKAKTSTVHISNLVHAIKLAIENGKGGEIYFITDDEIVSFRSFLTNLLNTQDIIPSHRSISGKISSFIALLLEKIWRIFQLKGEPPITRFAADIMTVNCTINIEKAKQYLNYSPILTIKEGMVELKELYKNNS